MAAKTKKKAPTKKGTKRPPKMRQTRIPGTEAAVDPEVHAAGVLYVSKRDARMDASKEEKAAKVALIATMKRLDVMVYKDMEADPPAVIVRTAKDDVKVTTLGDDDPEMSEVPEEQADAEKRADDSEPKTSPAPADTGDDREEDEDEPPKAA